jgi:hypothetical protein
VAREKGSSRLDYQATFSKQASWSSLTRLIGTGVLGWNMGLQMGTLQKKPRYSKGCLILLSGY